MERQLYSLKSLQSMARRISHSPMHPLEFPQRIITLCDRNEEDLRKEETSLGSRLCFCDSYESSLDGVSSWRTKGCFERFYSKR